MRLGGFHFVHDLYLVFPKQLGLRLGGDMARDVSFEGQGHWKGQERPSFSLIGKGTPYCHDRYVGV